MTVQTDPRLARLSVDTIRFLAADAVEKAQSGHPGEPVVGVDQVVGAGALSGPGPGHCVREGSELRQEVLLGQAFVRARGHVPDQDAGGEYDAGRQVRRRGPGEDGPVAHHRLDGDDAPRVPPVEQISPVHLRSLSQPDGPGEPLVDLRPHPQPRHVPEQKYRLRLDLPDALARPPEQPQHGPVERGG